MKLRFDGNVAAFTGRAMGIGTARAQQPFLLGDHAELIQSGEYMHVPTAQTFMFLSGGIVL